MIMYRKNSNWTTIYISIPTDELKNLGDYVEQEVHNQQNIKPNSRKWKAIDIVDTTIIGSNFHPSKDKTILELLVYVADMTGELI